MNNILRKIKDTQDNFISRTLATAMLFFYDENAQNLIILELKVEDCWQWL